VTESAILALRGPVPRAHARRWQGRLLLAQRRRSGQPDAAEVARVSSLMGAIVEGSPFATMAFDTERRLTFWNPAAERLFGWRAEEVLGGPMPPGSIPDDEVVASGERIDRTLAGATIAGERVRRVTRDGRHITVEIHAGPLYDDSGRLLGYAGQMVDITEREESRHERALLTADMSHLREIEADLALVMRVRDILAAAAQHVVPNGALEPAAQVICDELRRLPAVDFAAVGAFVGDQDVVLVASNTQRAFPMQSGERVPTHRAARLRQLADGGPWAEVWVSAAEDGDWGGQLDRAGLKAFAFAPITHGDHVDGGLVIGTADERFGATLVDKWASVLDLSTTPSALLADRLHARREEMESRTGLEAAIAAQDFHPVFQPIVELRTGAIAGYEALTRFGSNERPDVTFARAWAVGLGPQLEYATITAAIREARRLPRGRWLNLNVSARLLDDPDGLGALLSAANRPVVLEITEHEMVVDYGRLRTAVATLGHGVRVAVDDAGAGVANFGHIVELGADLVKLDLGLVRGVDASLGRQALVVGMRHFAGAAGCRLVAEGVETAEEAQTLTELGVDFGQGFWFGRPERLAPRPNCAAGGPRTRRR
jgi:PAS domain S-box-containing protein